MGFHLLKHFDIFSVNFNNYVNYAVRDVQPLLIACLHQESNASSCPPTQRTQNGLLCNTFETFGKCLTTVGDNIAKLVKGNTNFIYLLNPEIKIVYERHNLQSLQYETEKLYVFVYLS